MLDDAAFFAVNTLEDTFFVLTASFTTTFKRPISSGTMRAVGTVVNNSDDTKLFAKAIVYDDVNKEIGSGEGIFIRSKMLLSSAAGYN